MREKLLHTDYTWTRAEAYAMQGRRVRFKDGREGTVRNVAESRHGNTVHGYSVEVTPDGDMTLGIAKPNASVGPFAFELLPGPPVSEEVRLSLPEWGQPVARTIPDLR